MEQKTRKQNICAPGEGGGFAQHYIFLLYQFLGEISVFSICLLYQGSLEELLCSEIAKFSPMLLLLLLQCVARYLPVIRIQQLYEIMQL